MSTADVIIVVVAVVIVAFGLQRQWKAHKDRVAGRASACSGCIGGCSAAEKKNCEKYNNAK